MTKLYSDGMPINFISHPRPKWYIRIWQRIKAIFVRPRFSKEALEPAEEVEMDDSLDN